MNTNDYNALAQKAYTNLRDWFPATVPDGWIPQDYWKTPTITRGLIRYALLDDAAGKDVRTTVDSVYKAGYDALTWCAFLDDLAAWGRMFAAAADWLATSDPAGAKTYRTEAGAVYDQLENGWDSTCDGGVWWMRDAGGSDNFKASVSTMQYADIGGSLGKDMTRAWEWELSTGLVDEHHIVWGGTDSSCGRNPKNPPSAADQGHTIGAMLGLYAVTKDTRWLQTGCDVAAGAMATMTWPGTQVLLTSIDAKWRDQSEDWRVNNADPTLSKGLFVENLGDFAALLTGLGGQWAAPAATQSAFLRANADALAAQYPQAIYDMDWLHGDASYTGDGDALTQSCLQYSALATFIAAAKNPG
jgi:hypothetical protein